MDEDKQPTDNQKEKEKSFISKKCSEVMKQISEEETVIRGKQYMKDNVAETVAGILLIVGFVLSVWFPLFGSSLVAFVSGLVFSPPLVRIVGRCVSLCKKGTVFKPFVLTVFFLTALLIYSYPIICLVGAVALRRVIQPKRHPLFEESKKEEE